MTGQAQGSKQERWFGAGGYLSLEVKGQHGKAEVQHEILGLEAFQCAAHSEGHPALALN